MAENYPDIERSWTENPVPYSEGGEILLSAWTTDEGLADQAAELSWVYGNKYDLDTEMPSFRSRLRTAAMTTASSAILVRRVLDAGVAELIDETTTEAQLNVLVTVASAGYGGAILATRSTRPSSKSGSAQPAPR